MILNRENNLKHLNSRLVRSSCATVSWVARRTPVGFFVKDYPPLAQANITFLTHPNGYRISNFINCWLDSLDGGGIKDYGFYPDSGLYQNLSFFKIPSENYPPLQTARLIFEDGVAGVDFEQIAGARTISPAVIGGSVGMLLGSILGLKLGTYLANTLMNYPPIWTHIKLRLLADGHSSVTLLDHSFFPCNTLYQSLPASTYQSMVEYKALYPQQKAWSSYGWEGFNPWHIPRPAFSIFNSKNSWFINPVAFLKRNHIRHWRTTANEIARSRDGSIGECNFRGMKQKLHHTKRLNK